VSERNVITGVSTKLTCCGARRRLLPPQLRGSLAGGGVQIGGPGICSQRVLIW
jgi:hypothetical protein